jgi:GH25 family lysozyme M1 (1,4-beta-N-acetylmuramidase)
VITVFGVDVSGWDGSVDWNAAADSGIEFAFAKATEGVHFKDRTWADNRAGMLALGERFVPGAYCFLRGDADIAQQVEIFLDTVGDVSQLMIALDVETQENAARQATVADAMKWVAIFKSHTGGHPVVGYVPRWYWDQNGQGDLSFFDALWESHYLSGEGTPEELHDRVPTGWWRPYGNGTVSILQFTESCTVPGFPEGPCDVNIYQGDRSQLRALTLTGTTTLVIPDGTPPLTLNASEVRVVQLQNALNKAGLTPRVDVDGEFGPMTETGVKWLQQKANIAVSGVYDEETEAALRTVLQTVQGGSG